MKKPFSKSLYDASDSKAKENMILWLLEKFPKCSINSKETTYFDITLETDNGSPDHFYEVEIKYSGKKIGLIIGMNCVYLIERKDC